jgi:hypothetical protein
MFKPFGKAFNTNHQNIGRFEEGKKAFNTNRDSMATIYNSIQNGRFEEGKGFSRPNPVEDRLKNSGFPDIRPPKEFQV